MIRAHLLGWRRNLQVDNLAEYLTEVEKLPVEDRLAAKALWTAGQRHRMAVLIALHHMEVL